MTASKKAISVSKSEKNQILSAAQKRFNSLIKKIDAEKKRLTEWQETIPQYHQKTQAEYEPKLASFEQLQLELVHVFDAAYEDKFFKKADKDKLKYLITDILEEITSDLTADSINPELKSLYNKYHDHDFESMDSEKEDMMNEMAKSLLKDMFNIDMEDDFDMRDVEKARQLFEQKLQEKQEQAEKQEQEAILKKSAGKKTAKQIAKEEKQQQEEQAVSKSIQQIYRKLASSLHPDREPDETERERKTKLMQQVNSAYEKKDLLRLLELQLEIEQIDPEHINNIADAQLKHFNKILKEQLDELEAETQFIEMNFLRVLNIPFFDRLKPKDLMRQLEVDIHELSFKAKNLRRDIENFQQKENLKHWLKDFRIPKQPRFNFEDIFRF